MNVEKVFMEGNVSSLSSPSPHHQIPKWKIKEEGVSGSDDDEYEPGKELKQTTLTQGQYEYEGSDSGEEEPQPKGEPMSDPEKNSTCQEAGPSGNGKRNTTPKNPKIYSCSECKISYTGKPKLVEHSMVFHPEKFFPPAPAVTKSDKIKLTPVQSNMYTIHMLNTEVDYCEKPNGYKCIYCGMTLVKRRGAIIMHLIKKHQNILRQELIQLQKEKTVDEIGPIVKMPVLPIALPKEGSSDDKFKLKHLKKEHGALKMMKEFTCSICGVRTINLRMHQVFYHPEKILAGGLKSKEMDMELFKQYCVYLIDKQVDKIKESQEGRDKGEIRVRCPHCQNVYTAVNTCRHHVITVDQDILGEELKKLQQTIGPDALKEIGNVKQMGSEVRKERCKVCDVVLTKAGILKHLKRAHPQELLGMGERLDCGAGFSTQGALEDHQCKRQKTKVRIERKRGSGQHVCGICKRRFVNISGLKYHNLLSHVEELFESMREEGVDGEEFKKWCEEVMEGEEEGLEGVCGENGKMRWRCGYCEETCSSRKLVCVHLVGKHKEIMEGKVRKLQEVRVREANECGISGIKVETEREQDEWDDDGERMIVDIKQENYENGEEAVLPD